MGKSYRYNEHEYGSDHNSYRRLQDRKKKANRDDDLKWLEENDKHQVRE